MSEFLEPLWLNKDQVLYIHTKSIELFGGTLGIRDEGLLESALDRAKNRHLYGENDLFLLAAYLASGICRNHAFLDGNKRTAYSCAGLFLYYNHYMFVDPSPEETIKLFEKFAASKVNEEHLAKFYALNSTRISPP